MLVRFWEWNLFGGLHVAEEVEDLGLGEGLEEALGHHGDGGGVAGADVRLEDGGGLLADHAEDDLRVVLLGAESSLGIGPAWIAYTCLTLANVAVLTSVAAFIRMDHEAHVARRAAKSPVLKRGNPSSMSSMGVTNGYHP